MEGGKRAMTRRGTFNMAHKFSVDCLRKSSFFEGISEACLEELLTEFGVQIFSDQDIILTQGETAEKLYCINHGGVEVQEGDEQVEVLQGLGTVFGQVALFRALGGPSKVLHTVRAAGLCDMRTLHYKTFEKVLQRFPADRALFLKKSELEVQRRKALKPEVDRMAGTSKSSSFRPAACVPGKSQSQPFTPRGGLGASAAAALAIVREQKARLEPRQSARSGKNGPLEAVMRLLKETAPELGETAEPSTGTGSSQLFGDDDTPAPALTPSPVPAQRGNRCRTCPADNTLEPRSGKPLCSPPATQEALPLDELASPTPSVQVPARRTARSTTGPAAPRPFLQRLSAASRPALPEPVFRLDHGALAALLGTAKSDP